MSAFIGFVRPWLIGLAALLFSQDGAHAEEWQPRTVLRGHAAFIGAVAISADGKWIASGDKDGVILVWDAGAAKEKWKLEGHKDRITSLAFSPDCKQIASGSFDKTARVWDVSTGKAIEVIDGFGHWVNAVIFSPDGKSLAIGGSNKRVHFWDLAAQKETFAFDNDFFAVSCLAFSKEGKQLAVGSHSGTVRLYDVETRKAMATFAQPNSVTALALSGDNKVLAVASGSLLSLDKAGSLKVWDVATQKEVADLKGHEAIVWSLALSPDAKWLVTGSFDSTTRIWNLQTSKEQGRLAGPKAPVLAVAYSQDGKMIATGSYDKNVMLWDAPGAPTKNVPKTKEPFAVAKFVEKKLGFQALMPFQVETKKSTLPTRDGEAVVHTFAGKDGKWSFLIRCTELPAKARQKTAEQLFKEAKNDALGIDDEVVDEKESKLGVHPGRELLTAADGKSFGRIRFYLIGDKFFQIQISGPEKPIIAGDDGKRFLDSFQELPRELTPAERVAKETELNGLMEKAFALSDAKKHNEALKVLDQAEKLATELYGAESPALALIFGQQGNMHFRERRLDRAEKLYRQGLALLNPTRDPDEALMAATLRIGLAQLMIASAKYTEAESMLLEARKLAPATGDSALLVQFHLGECYLRQRKFDQAEPLIRDCLKLVEKGDLDPTGHLRLLAESYLADLLAETKRGDEAEKTYLQVLDQKRWKAEMDRVGPANALAGLAKLYSDRHDYDKALALIPRLGDFAEPPSVPIGLRLLKAREVFANLLIWKGDVAAAGAMLEVNIRAIEELHGPKSIQLVLPLLFRSFVSVGASRLKEGETGLLRAIAIMEEAKETDNPAMMLALGLQYTMVAVTGDYARAETIARKAHDIIERSKDDSVRDFALMLFLNEGRVLLDTGRKAEGLARLEKARQHLENRRGPSVVPEETILLQLGVMYLYQNELDKAEEVFQRSLQLSEKTFDRDHPMVANVLQFLVDINDRKGRVDRAREYAERILAIREVRFGKESFFVGTACRDLAELLVRRGDFDRASQMLQRSRDILVKHLGPDSVRVASVYATEAELFVKKKDLSRAADAFDACRRIDCRHVNRVLPLLDESQQLSFLEETDAGVLFTALSLPLSQPDDGKLAEHSAAWILNGKAVALQALAQRQVLARASREPRVGPLVRDWIAVRQQIAGLSISTPTEQEVEQRGQRLRQLHERERELNLKIGEGVVAGWQKDPWIELERVRAAIPADGVLVEFVRMPVRDFQAKTSADPWLASRYAAWVIPAAGKGAVRFIDLGPAEEIDDAIRGFRALLNDPVTAIATAGERTAETQMRQALTAVGKKILEPLRKELDQAERWLISPDGELWLVPWAALPLDEASYAIERHRISLLMSGRDLLAPIPDVKTGPPLVVGNPLFDLDYEEALKETRSLLKLPPPVVEPRRAISQAFSRLPRRWQRLKGAELEIEAIRGDIAQLAGAEPVVLSGRQALEGVVRATERPSLLVLATHGYFLEPPGFSKPRVPQHAPEPATDLALTFDDDPLSKVRIFPSGSGNKPLDFLSFKDTTILMEHPALTCGLVLAGVNKRGQGDPDGEDGVLTAWEIVGMDLRGTRLVVLSACETGLGRVQEFTLHPASVAGLRQAFLVAGARNVVASLWKVPDADTAELMKVFYRELAAGKNEESALRDAQLARISARREAGKAAHPFFWAAFNVLSQGETKRILAP